ncbi:MAG: hypothetical protein BWZ02_02962 [Lentisphaerae bacterium ADurb.BinA184]|nr:MAG: hypothetical protein BWZ02_02962 [Lentisphaerae bacterium ADurb.BinA184]
MGRPRRPRPASETGHLHGPRPDPCRPRRRIRDVLLQPRHPAVGHPRRTRRLGCRPQRPQPGRRRRRLDGRDLPRRRGRRRHHRHRSRRTETVERQARHQPRRGGRRLCLRLRDKLVHPGDHLPVRGPHRSDKALHPRRQGTHLRSHAGGNPRAGAAGKGHRHGRPRGPAGARLQRRPPGAARCGVRKAPPPVRRRRPRPTGLRPRRHPLRSPRWKGTPHRPRNRPDDPGADAGPRHRRRAGRGRRRQPARRRHRPRLPGQGLRSRRQDRLHLRRQGRPPDPRRLQRTGHDTDELGRGRQPGPGVGRRELEHPAPRLGLGTRRQARPRLPRQHRLRRHRMLPARSESEPRLLRAAGVRTRPRTRHLETHAHPLGARSGTGRVLHHQHRHPCPPATLHQRGQRNRPRVPLPPRLRRRGHGQRRLPRTRRRLAAGRRHLHGRTCLRKPRPRRRRGRTARRRTGRAERLRRHHLERRQPRRQSPARRVHRGAGDAARR